MPFLTSSRAPVIGISGAHPHSRSVLATIAMLRGIGAVPLYLGNHKKRDAAADVKRCQGIIVLGNDRDIPPTMYGRDYQQYIRTGADKARLSYEKALLQAALQSKVPVLGICAGMQWLNVLDGGTLYPHLPNAFQTQVHEQWRPSSQRKVIGVPAFLPVHGISLVPGTRLAKMLEREGGYVATGDIQQGKPDFQENSMHHQGIHIIGPNFQVAARETMHGSIEAIEPAPKGKYRNQWVFGVQWHPEFGASPVSALLMQQFVKAAKHYGKQQGVAEPDEDLLYLESARSAAVEIKQAVAHNLAPAKTWQARLQRGANASEAPKRG